MIQRYWKTLTDSGWAQLSLDQWATLLIDPPTPALIAADAHETFAPLSVADSFSTGSAKEETFAPGSKQIDTSL